MNRVGVFFVVVMLLIGSGEVTVAHIDTGLSYIDSAGTSRAFLIGGMCAIWVTIRDKPVSRLSTNGKEFYLVYKIYCYRVPKLQEEKRQWIEQKTMI